MSDEQDRGRARRGAQRKVALSRLWARAKQILTTDPQRNSDDDFVVESAAAATLASEAGSLKGGLAKVAQLAAYEASATGEGIGRAGQTALAKLWDNVPPMSAAAIEVVVEEELGVAPTVAFATWESLPMAAASLGQVHAATDEHGNRLAVKVQYPAVAAAFRSDLSSTAFTRRLAGAAIGEQLDTEALASLRQAMDDELDYQREAEGLRRFAEAWQDDPNLRIPSVDEARSTGRVLTMSRATGVPLAHWNSDDKTRATVATAIARFAWGSPLVHNIFNTDPHPGNFLVDDSGEIPLVWCLDFGGWIELPVEIAEADRELWWGLIDDDEFQGAERFRMGLQAMGLLTRSNSLSTAAHREWERLLALPLRPGGFVFTPSYASELATQFGAVMRAGGVSLPASVAMLWRQRLGVAAVLGRLSARVDGRALISELIGHGRRSLRVR